METTEQPVAETTPEQPVEETTTVEQAGPEPVAETTPVAPPVVDQEFLAAKEEAITAIRDVLDIAEDNHRAKVAVEVTAKKIAGFSHFATGFVSRVEVGGSLGVGTGFGNSPAEAVLAIADQMYAAQTAAARGRRTSIQLAPLRAFVNA